MSSTTTDRSILAISATTRRSPRTSTASPTSLPISPPNADRGGYNNNDGLLPLDPNPAVRANFVGSDDHPGYLHAQIAEALLADAVNAIA